MTTTDLIDAYYAAFNAGDMDIFLELLTEDVVHDINQGERQVGGEDAIGESSHAVRAKDRHRSSGP